MPSVPGSKFVCMDKHYRVRSCRRAVISGSPSCRSRSDWATPLALMGWKSFGRAARRRRFTRRTSESVVSRNEFVSTTRRFTDFVLRLKFKLVGTEGFVNGGVQIRSERTQKPPNEMSGYQVDMGDPEWWGCLYDESRRNKVVAKSDIAAINKVLKRQDWNEYVIRAEGKRIRASINGVQTVDYTEPDDSIPQFGKIGLQVHGGGKTEAWYKDITIEELP